VARRRLILRCVLGAALGATPALPAQAATYRLSLAEAVQMALRQSPAARRLQLEDEHDTLLHRGARRALAPDLAFDLVAPDYAQQFEVVPLPSAPGDTVLGPNGEPPRLVYGKSTTTSRNGTGALNLRQLLPWRGVFSASGSVVYRDEETTPAELRAPRRDYTVSTGVGLDVSLIGDDPVRRELRRADIQWQQALERRRADRAEVEFQTVSSYLQLLRARAALEIGRADAEHASQAYEIARRKVAAGLLADVDRLKLEVFGAQRQAHLTQAEAELARASDEFKLYLGMSVQDSLVLAEELVPFELQTPVDAWVTQALDRRAELGLLEGDIALLELDRAARRAWRPDVALAVRYGGAATETALDRALQNITANDLSLRLAVHLPLWDSGRLELADAAERTNVQLRELELETTRARIELEVRDAVRQLEDARRRHEIFAASTLLADDLLRITGERYERGLIDTQTYLGAQADAASAHLENQAALLDLYQARARLRLVALDEESR